jgi:methyl-accepting chemotaxis protein
MKFFKGSKKDKTSFWIFTIAVVAISCVAVAYMTSLQYKIKLPLVSLVAAKDALIKNQVQTAVTMLDGVYKKVQARQITLAQAKVEGADLLRDLRYDNGQGYFWADTVGGVNVVLYGNKDIEGKNRLNAKSGKVEYVKEMIKAGQLAGGGYTEYSYPKLGETIAQPKRAYTLFYQPFNWIIGTGYYLEDVK